MGSSRRAAVAGAIALAPSGVAPTSIALGVRAGFGALPQPGREPLRIDTAGASSCRGRVNNATLLTLDPAILPITTADCTPYANQAGCTATAADGVASLAVAPDVANDLQIILRFASSLGDSVGITSRFEVASTQSSIPEPSTASLLGIGGALLGGIRRRRTTPLRRDSAHSTR